MAAGESDPHGEGTMGSTPAQSASAVRLLTLVNDVSFRRLIPAELAKGFDAEPSHSGIILDNEHLLVAAGEAQAYRVVSELPSLSRPLYATLQQPLLLQTFKREIEIDQRVCRACVT